MTDIKLLVFDIWADYAQFRKYYANMSPLTFLIPPRTVLAGIMGAILGISRDTTPETFYPDTSFFAVQILNEPQRRNYAINYLKTSASRWQFVRYQEYKQTMCEYLKNPAYRIYFQHNDEQIYRKAKAYLAAHKSHYTVSLGISNCLADFRFVNEVSAKYLPLSEECPDSPPCYKLSTAISKKTIRTIKWQDESRIYTSKMPYSMKNTREVTEYREYIFEISGIPICVYADELYRVEPTGEIISPL